MDKMKLKINKERLERNLYQLGKIGRNEHGGIDRALGSKEDLLAREWLKAYWEVPIILKLSSPMSFRRRSARKHLSF